MADRKTLLCVHAWLILLLACFAWPVLGERAAAQPPAIEPASYERKVSNAAPATIHFARQRPRVGDQTEQSINVHLQLKTMVRQGDEVVEQTATSIGRRQRRLVTATEVSAGRATAASIHYIEATKQIATGPRMDDLKQGPATPQPVADKSYHCRRVGDELRITDAGGSIPPLDQFEIVAQNMDSLGRANPLAEFLAGRSVRVGQTLKLPRELAEKLLGLGDALGQVSRFDLTLERVERGAAGARGVFQASIDAASSDSSQMRLELDGPLVIDAATCRPLEAELAGPIGMSETRGSLTDTYQMIGTGRMTIHIASRYDDVAR